MRRALCETLNYFCNEPRDLVLLTGDLGFGTFEEFKLANPNRYINVGIMEQSLVNIAAGISSQGYLPVVYSIASFLTSRSYEQIKLNCGYNDLQMILIGAGGGLTYEKSGATHHSNEDFALMGTIPGMQLFCPSTPSQIKSIFGLILNNRTSAYIRIGKYGEPEFPNHSKVNKDTGLTEIRGTSASSKLIVSFGKSWNIFDLELSGYFLENSCDHININNLNGDSIEKLSEIITNYGTIFILEEHFEFGGLYEKLRKVHQNRESRIIRIGPSFNYQKLQVIDHKNGKSLGFGVKTIKELVESPN